MVEKNKEMLDVTIKTLNTMGFENNNIMILGSIALDICGLFPMYRSNAHDVDVMVKCSEQKEKEIISLIKLINSTLSNKVISGSESSSIVLTLPNIIINFWFVREDYKFDTLIKLDNGVWVENPVDCFKKKRQYGRVKDYHDLQNIVITKNTIS